FEMLRSFSCCWVSGIKRMGGFGDKGFGLEGWLRVAVDGSNWFGRDWWPRKIRSVVEGCGCDRSLFWAAVLGAVRVMEIGYDGCVLRLEGCPKDIAVGGSKMVRVWWVERRKKTKLIEGEKEKKKRKRRRGEKKEVPLLACASSPPAGRLHAVVALARWRFFSRARRRNISPRGEKDRDDGITKYFAAFHLYKSFPTAIIIDDFGDLFVDR
ncbi:hypothetical protein GW17_00051706, partial [Ensete ventricosum]